MASYYWTAWRLKFGAGEANLFNKIGSKIIGTRSPVEVRGSSLKSININLQQEFTQKFGSQVREYASSSRKRSGGKTNKEIAKIRAGREPYIITKSYLKKNQIQGTNPIFGTYSPLVRELLQSLNSEDSRLGNSSLPESSPLNVKSTDPAYGFTVEEVETIVHGVKQAEVIRHAVARRPLPVEIRDIKERQEILQRITSLRRSNLKEWQKHQIRQVIIEFGKHELDTGTAECQSAVLTVRILGIAEHLRYNPKDYSSSRRLTMLVQQRNNTLKYLRKKSILRYTNCIKKLGLNDSVVLKEFRYSQRLLE
ncbi:hypothetical protein V1511DRAFT_224064 [Dipodascopsis uninucleata]